MSYTFDVFRGSESGRVQRDTITRELGHGEALVEITDGSICGTDFLYLHSQQVLGHEGAGIVRALGGQDTSFQVGDRVGLAYLQKVCDECKNCKSGWGQYCGQRESYGKSDINRGSFGSMGIWDTKSLIPIPENYASADAAALLCGGATAWTVLTSYGIQQGQRVAILGIGGLGHLAIKLAAAKGYHVIALLRSESKKEDCLRFGAKEFHICDSDGNFPEVRDVDHLLLCGSVQVGFNLITPMMATHGTIYPLTVNFTPEPVPLLALIDNGLRIQGSFIASPQSMKEMLEFCARENVKPAIEKHKLSSDGIQDAAKAVQMGTARYKCVLSKD